MGVDDDDDGGVDWDEAVLLLDQLEAAHGSSGLDVDIEDTMRASLVLGTLYNRFRYVHQTEMVVRESQADA